MSEKNINEAVNEYLTKRKELINEYDNDVKEYEKESAIVSKRIHYDVREISNSELKGHISEMIAINVPVYNKYAGIVFDPGSYNFHVFPKQEKICAQLKHEFDLLREALIKKLPKDFSITSEGSGNNFALYNNILQAVNKKEPRSMIYKYITVKYKKEEKYTINFMRYTCNNGVVGCTMRAIQFHKGLQVNKGLKNQFQMCYPETDQNFDYRYNDAGKICYNPPVSYPQLSNNEFKKDDIESIVTHFKAFIGCFEGNEDGGDNEKSKNNKENIKKFEDWVKKQKEKYENQQKGLE